MTPSRILAFLFCCLIPAAWADDAQPKITRIRGRLVKVSVPAGFDSVSLQRVRFVPVPKGRAQRVWATVDTQFPSAEATTLTFRLTRLTSRRYLRVVGSRTQPMPESFTSGITSFGADTLSLQSNSSGSVARVADASLGGTAVLSGSVSSLNLSTSAAGSPAPAAVVESDIWKIDGDRLYFFNQLRGLQVIDVANPDDPALLGTLRMPASGEDLYLLDPAHVALLKRSENWWWGSPILLAPVRLNVVGGGIIGGSVLRTGSAMGALSINSAALAPATTLIPTSDASRENELVIADVSAGAPAQIASVPFKGALRESRLVGHVLYIAAGASRENAGAYEYGTTITAFDLSDPANPAERDSVFIPGWGATVTATSDYFILSAGWPDMLHLVDISAGDGTLKLAGSIAPEGFVADKFKINVESGVLTVISQVWRPWTWDATNGWAGGGMATVLETFSLADPAAPTALGRLVLAEGETLRATRFDAGRVYIVTFQQLTVPWDPLHVVDLSDPANPTLSGAVDMPGFSTYIEPLGDRLVSIGLIDWKPAVSLYDVSDPAAPKVLQQLTLGGKNDGWSSSEAVWNEKAFKVLADKNLILLPISGIDLSGTDQWGGEWFSRVQLVDLHRDSLAARGVIDASFSPRRADVVKANRIAAISPAKLVIVNAGNRDLPKITAEIELAWSVDRIFHIGDYVVELGGSADSLGKPTPSLTVAPASNPDETLAALDLDPLDVVGSTVREGTLFVAQRAWPRWWVSDASADKPQLLVTAFDVSALPAVKKLSQASGPAPVNSWGRLTALWPSPGTLVWAADGQYLSWEAPQPLATDATGGAVGVNSLTIFRPWWWGTWSKEFISFSVGVPAKIAYGSTVELKPANYSLLGAPAAQAGLVFISEQQTWDDAPDSAASDAGKHFLRVIDYSEPAAPFIRDERVNIPGRLVSVARDGKLLYTVGSDLDPSTGAAKETPALHASTFDGAAAHLVATEPLPSLSSPLAFAGANVVFLDQQPASVWKPAPVEPLGDGTLGTALVLRWPGYWGGTYEENPLKSTLHVAQLTDAGAFTELGSLELAHDFGLHLFGDLAVTQPDYRSIRAIDLSNTLAPADLGSFVLPGGWPNLDGADGALGAGLWIPAGSYGVETLGLAR